MSQHCGREKLQTCRRRVPAAVGNGRRRPAPIENAVSLGTALPPTSFNLPKHPGGLLEG